jgi:hypothetical protein
MEEQVLRQRVAELERKLDGLHLFLTATAAVTAATLPIICHASPQMAEQIEEQVHEAMNQAGDYPELVRLWRTILDALPAPL